MKQAGKFEGLPRRLVHRTGTRWASEPWELNSVPKIDANNLVSRGVTIRRPLGAVSETSNENPLVDNE